MVTFLSTLISRTLSVMNVWITLRSYPITQSVDHMFCLWIFLIAVSLLSLPLLHCLLILGSLVVVGNLGNNYSNNLQQETKLQQANQCFTGTTNKSLPASLCVITVQYWWRIYLNFDGPVSFISPEDNVGIFCGYISANSTVFEHRLSNRVTAAFMIKY